MPNDWTIAGVGPPAAGAPVADRAQAKPEARVAPAGSASALPNPTLRLDASLGIVVIEFRNNAGEVANSIPTQQQLEIYRLSSQAAAKKPHAGEPAATDKPAPAPAKAKPPIVA
jgi:hypothetical protein